MDITFNCDQCGQNIVIDEAGAGLATECPRCGQPLTVPSQPQRQAEPSAITPPATEGATPPVTEKLLAAFHGAFGHAIKRVERDVRQRRNKAEVAKLYDMLGKIERSAQETVQSWEPLVVGLENRLRRGETPTLLESCRLIEGREALANIGASAVHLVYSNLIGNFLGSAQEWLAKLTQENPNDERIGTLKPLIDKWTKIKAAGSFLGEKSYSDFLAELARISDEHPLFVKPEECREEPVNTLLDVQRRIEDLLNRPELERRLNAITTPILTLRDRFGRLRDIRPMWFADFVGQDRAKERLEVAVEASRRRGETLPHVLLVGPHGMGKATLGHLVSFTTKTVIRAMLGEEIDNAAFIPGAVDRAKGRFIFLIENAERMRPPVREEMLRFINLPGFTLVCTTTRMERLPDAMLSRFSIKLEFTEYTREELAAIGQRLAIGLGLELDQPALAELAKHSDGTPRGVLNSLRYVKDYALVKSESLTITAETVVAALGAGGASAQDIDDAGQDRHAIPSSVRMEVWRRDGGKCVKCGGRERLEYDHIIPIAKGGSNTARNIELLCENCNRSKSDRIE
jgi:Holliday junction resolvasome RuvABC ATP-dependent DNA helicase subunit